MDKYTCYNDFFSYSESPILKVGDIIVFPGYKQYYVSVHSSECYYFLQGDACPNGGIFDYLGIDKETFCSIYYPQSGGSFPETKSLISLTNCVKELMRLCETKLKQEITRTNTPQEACSSLSSLLKQGISPLDRYATMKEMVDKINEIVIRVNESK